MPCSSCSALHTMNSNLKIKVVALSRETEFNKILSMKLHQIEPSLWYLDILDEFSRFRNAVIIKSKTDSMKMFIKQWICIFGAPHCIFSDNGVEFINNTFYKIVKLQH